MCIGYVCIFNNELIMMIWGKYSCVFYIFILLEYYKYNNIDLVVYFLMFVENFFKFKIKKIFLIWRWGVCYWYDINFRFNGFYGNDDWIGLFFVYYVE